MRDGRPSPSPTPKPKLKPNPEPDPCPYHPYPYPLPLPPTPTPQVREDLRSRMDQQVREALATQEAQARERVNHLSQKLHHLRSTATCAGIYNSAYHVGHHPTAFGIPVEEHLRTAIRPLIKAPYISLDLPRSP